MIQLLKHTAFLEGNTDQLPFEFTQQFAQQLDNEDELKEFRNQFFIPNFTGEECIYFTGNSLGCMPKKAREFVEQEFADWQKFGVEGHFHGKRPWFEYHHFLKEKAAKVVGAKPSEVVMMNSLTNNLHLLMVSFYRPTKTKYKIIMEGGAFPSDQYAMESQVRFHGFNPDDSIIELVPRQGENTLRTEDILATIEQYKNELALVMMGGVNYYTGQAFEMDKITKKAHEVGVFCGFDLAHAAGNLMLQLHDWDVDFAVWCSYKYMNSGPGGISGIFVHDKYDDDKLMPRFAGWWGHDEKERFKMKKGFIPMKGADAWQISNAQVFPSAIHLSSLEIFENAGIEKIRNKGILLSSYLYFIIENLNVPIKVLTPKNAQHRGCQLSLVVENGKKLFDFLTENNIVADWREPDVIRVAPVPLYNTFLDVYRFGKMIETYYNLK